MNKIENGLYKRIHAIKERLSIIDFQDVLKLGIAGYTAVGLLAIASIAYGAGATTPAEIFAAIKADKTPIFQKYNPNLVQGCMTVPFTDIEPDDVGNGAISSFKINPDGTARVELDFSGTEIDFNQSGFGLSPFGVVSDMDNPDLYINAIMSGDADPELAGAYEMTFFVPGSSTEDPNDDTILPVSVDFVFGENMVNLQDQRDLAYANVLPGEVLYREDRVGYYVGFWDNSDQGTLNIDLSMQDCSATHPTPTPIATYTPISPSATPTTVYTPGPDNTPTPQPYNTPTVIAPSATVTPSSLDYANCTVVTPYDMWAEGEWANRVWITSVGGSSRNNEASFQSEDGNPKVSVHAKGISVPTDQTKVLGINSVFQCSTQPNSRVMKIDIDNQGNSSSSSYSCATHGNGSNNVFIPISEGLTPGGIMDLVLTLPQGGPGDVAASYTKIELCNKPGPYPTPTMIPTATPTIEPTCVPRPATPTPPVETPMPPDPDVYTENIYLPIAYAPDLDAGVNYCPADGGSTMDLLAGGNNSSSQLPDSLVYELNKLGLEVDFNRFNSQK